MDWPTVFSALALAAFLGAGLAMLALRTFVSEGLKQAIKSEYDQKLEAHKSQLASQSATEIEKLKSQLSSAAAERHLRLSHLHEKRAEVIAKVYELLKPLHHAMATYVNPAQFSGTSDDERRNKAADAHRALQDYYTSRSIFVPKVTAAKIDDLLATYRKAFVEFHFRVEQDEKAERYERWMKISDHVESLGNTVLAELEDEFRKLLGDEPEE